MMRSLGLIALIAAACGGGAMPIKNPSLLTINFEYHARTTPDPEVDPCFVGATHIHPSWRNFEVVPLHARGPDLWSAGFSDVVAGSHKIRVSDPNACRTSPTGAVTDHLVVANGVLLTRAVETPGDGIEPGFGFLLEPDGSIVP